MSAMPGIMDLRVGFLLAVIISNLDIISCDNTCNNNGFTMVSSVNHLSFSIAGQLYKNHDNFLYSPLGISTVLGMAYLGARGQTAKEIEDSLLYTALGIAGIQVHADMRNMTSDLRARIKNQYTLNLANALFLRSGLNLNDNYRTELRTYYDGMSRYLDFDSAPDVSMSTINEWIRNSTSSKIKKLLDAPLPPETVAFLINAIYFKGNWKLEFPVQRTVANYFLVAGENREVTAHLMTLSKEKFRYLSDEKLGYKFLEMPYKGEEVSMLFALPLQYNQIPDLNMTHDLLCNIRSNMRNRKLDVIAIPRFKLEYEESLKSILRHIGITDAFSAGSADFSSMRSEGGIHVSDVRHKAIIEVNEQGSEVAAVSGVHIMPISALSPPKFLATHSFLFYIIDTRTGLILFAGRLMEP